MSALKSIVALALVAASAPVGAHQLARSRELWATVDVCNTKAQPDTIGIRGSMPGDGRAGDSMYMRFLVQYFDTTSGKWVDLGPSAESGFLKVGSATTTGEAGRSFQFTPTAGNPSFTLRGLVIFQWRHGKTPVATLERPTAAGHVSLAGAEPPKFSAATCKIT